MIHVFFQHSPSKLPCSLLLNYNSTSLPHTSYSFHFPTTQFLLHILQHDYDSNQWNDSCFFQHSPSKLPCSLLLNYNSTSLPYTSHSFHFPTTQFLLHILQHDYDPNQWNDSCFFQHSPSKLPCSLLLNYNSTSLPHTSYSFYFPTTQFLLHLLQHDYDPNQWNDSCFFQHSPSKLPCSLLLNYNSTSLPHTSHSFHFLTTQFLLHLLQHDYDPNQWNDSCFFQHSPSKLPCSLLLNYNSTSLPHTSHSFHFPTTQFP